MNRTLVFVLLAICFANGCKHNNIVIRTEHEKSFQFFPLGSTMLEFLVKAKHDIYIRLTQEPSDKPPYYEVVFGGWSNQKSIIRKNNDDIQQQVDGNHVKPNQFAYYWVGVNDTDGTITVGTGLDRILLFNYTDANYIPMKYFGISTGYGSEGEWHFTMDHICCGQTNGLFKLDVRSFT